MKQIFSTLLGGATVAVLGYLAITSSAVAGSSAELDKCRFDSKKKVVDCCERALRGKRVPAWMIASGGSCSSAAVCAGKAPSRGGKAITHVVAKKKKYRCYISTQYQKSRDNGNQTKEPNQSQRDFNSQTQGF